MQSKQRTQAVNKQLYPCELIVSYFLHQLQMAVSFTTVHTWTVDSSPPARNPGCSHTSPDTNLQHPVRLGRCTGSHMLRGQRCPVWGYWEEDYQTEGSQKGFLPALHGSAAKSLLHRSCMMLLSEDKKSPEEGKHRWHFFFLILL